MKLKTTTVLKDAKGEPFKNEGEPALTVREALFTVLTKFQHSEQEKSKRQPILQMLLTDKIVKESDIDLKPEEVVYIKELVNESTYLPYIKGRLLSTLDS